MMALCLPNIYYLLSVISFKRSSDTIFLLFVNLLVAYFLSLEDEDRLASISQLELDVFLPLLLLKLYLTSSTFLYLLVLLETTPFFLALFARTFIMIIS